MPSKPTALHPYLGQPVLFWDSLLPRLDGQQSPRLAFVSGLCEDPGLVNLTVMNDPEQDVRLQGMTPVRVAQRVPFAMPTKDTPNGWRTFCQPVPAGTPAVLNTATGRAHLKIPLAGTIGERDPDAKKMTDADIERMSPMEAREAQERISGVHPAMTGVKEPERRIEPVLDDVPPVMQEAVTDRRRRRRPGRE